jgi:hypothetical protein
MPLVQDISRALGLSVNDVTRIVVTAPSRYKTYTIPKRSGGGVRTIAQPSRELKDIQRYLAFETLAKLPIHVSATAYIKGKNIRSNALAHAKNRVILKLDFQDFFHSISFPDLADALTRAPDTEVSSQDWQVLERALFWHNRQTGALCLSIGAPSSPFVSNAVMYQFDVTVSEIAQRHNAIYTRYADDISISADTVEELQLVQTAVNNAVANLAHPRLQFNTRKTGIYTKAGRRIITGLIITPVGRVSLGRKRKRQISAAVHHILVGTDRSNEHLSKTRGWLAFASSVEPFVVRSLRRKYGSVVDEILSRPVRGESSSD